MSYHATMKLRRQLDAVDVELAAADSSGARTALLPQVRMIRAQAAAVGIAEFAGVASLREGEIHLANGDVEVACDTLERAALALEATGATTMHTVALARWSEALLAGNDVVTALRVCAQGIALIERDRYKTSPPYLQASYLRRTIALYANGARAAHELGDPRALVWIELSKSRHLPGRRRSRVAAGPPDDTVVGERRELRDELAALSTKIDRYEARGRDTTGLRQKRRVRYDRLTTLDRREARPVAPEPQNVHDRLSSSQAVVSYYWLDADRLMITTITGTDIRSHVTKVPSDARQVLRDFADAVVGVPGALDGAVTRQGIMTAVRHLSPVLLPPEVLAGIKGADRLLVSPHRLLHTVPFGALTVEGVPLIRRASVTVIPNLTCLQLPHLPWRPTRALAVGAADCHVGVRRGDGEVAPPRTLPLAEPEARSVADIYRAAGVPADVLLGGKINEDELRRRCGDLGTSPTVLHLVMHGANVESDTPLESWLLLPHSRLDGIDLVQWRLDGCTVVLSACSAGQRAVGGRRMSELPGDDLFGLQTAFFDAGAHQVVGALWPVDGNVAAPLLQTFHEHMRDGATADVALQRAVVAFLDEANPFFMQPQYWAPFHLTALGMPTTLGGAS